MQMTGVFVYIHYGCRNNVYMETILIADAHEIIRQSIRSIIKRVIRMQID
jgi:hypothetical protein